MAPTKENSRILRKRTIEDSLASLKVSSRTFKDKRLTVLESVVKSLREKRKLSFRQIARTLNRHVRDIHNTYRAAVEKTISKPELELVSKKVVFIPVFVFRNRKLSPLEAVVSYLKDEEDLTYAAIARVLNRNQRTVWTAYTRAKKKYAKQKKKAS